MTDRGTPAALDAVEFYEVRKSSRVTFDLIEVNDIEAIAAVRIIVGTLRRSKG
jgi:hypothetical protein